MEEHARGRLAGDVPPDGWTTMASINPLCVRDCWPDDVARLALTAIKFLGIPSVFSLLAKISSEFLTFLGY